MRQAIAVLVCAVVAAWYGYVVVVSWPWGLAYWPMLVLAGALAWPAYGRLCDWLELRELRRRYDARGTSHPRS